MTDVTFIGLGLMGTALAEAAIKAGNKVALWNRTANKADTLIKQGAEFIPDINEAIAQSPITIICVGRRRHDLVAQCEIL